MGESYMKTFKFIGKCILAALPVIALVIFTAVCPMGYMDEEYPAWRYTMDVADNAGCDCDVLVLGDSRAMADLIPEVLTDKSCENLAVGGATTIEMYYFLERYLANNKAPETAVVMFAPFHYSYIDNFKTRTTYFNSLTVAQQIEVVVMAGAEPSGAACRSLEQSSIRFDDYVPYMISARLRLPDVYLPAMTNARFIRRKSQNEAAYANLVNMHGQGYFGTLDGCADLAYEASYTEMAQDADAVLIRTYAVKLLDLLAENNISVILAQPPMNEATYDNLDESYVNQYKEYINELCKPYDNVIFEDELIRYENEYFGDSSHLNEKGAMKFSKEFAKKYSDCTNF